MQSGPTCFSVVDAAIWPFSAVSPLAPLARSPDSVEWCAEVRSFAWAMRLFSWSIWVWRLVMPLSQRCCTAARAAAASAVADALMDETVVRTLGCGVAAPATLGMARANEPTSRPPASRRRVR